MEGKWFRQERKVEDMNNNNKVVKINNTDMKKYLPLNVLIAIGLQAMCQY